MSDENQTNENQMRDRINIEEKEDMEDTLKWLVDVPLFIDEDRVSRLYDVTVESVLQRYATDIADSERKQLEHEEEKVSGQVQGKIKGPSIFELSGTIGGESGVGSESESTFHYIHSQSAQRQLAQIALEYIERSGDTSDRNFYYVKNPGDPNGDLRSNQNEPRDNEGSPWYEVNRDPSPRNLVLLELPGKEDDQAIEPNRTKLVPTAAEFDDGNVEPIYERLGTGRMRPPKYPREEHTWSDLGDYYHEVKEEVAESDNESEKVNGQINELRDHYWDWFDQNFRADDVMRTIEEVAKDSEDIRWIDFRLPISDKGRTLHLHFQADSKYSTGTFAYNLVKRGYKHGLRIVGTIKSEPDMDVLAVYER